MSSPHSDCLYHVTPTHNLGAIALEGLVPRIGLRSRSAGEVQPWVHCFTSFEWVEKKMKGRWARGFERGGRLALLAINLSPRGAAPVECAYPVSLRPHLLWVVTDIIHSEADFAAIRDRECVMIKDYKVNAHRPLRAPGDVEANHIAAIDRLSDSHVLALAAYAAQRGRSRKTQLLAAWECAGAGAPDYTPELQQIRNLHGPELLLELYTPELLETGAQITAAPSGCPGDRSEALSVGPSP